MTISVLYQYVICMLYDCFIYIYINIRVLNHQSDNIALYPFHNPDTSSPFLVYELGFRPSPALPEPWDHRSPCASKTLELAFIIRNFRSWNFFPKCERKWSSGWIISLPETKNSPLKMNGWKTNRFFLGPGLFTGTILVSGRVVSIVLFFLGFGNGNDFEMKCEWPSEVYTRSSKG